MANILSQSNVKKKYRVPYDSTTKHCLNYTMKTVLNVFMSSIMRLFYSSVKIDIALVKTVEEKLNKSTVSGYSSAFKRT